MLIQKTIALLANLKEADVQALTPFERRRFADLCKHWGEIADRATATPPKAGVLFDLQRERAH